MEEKSEWVVIATFEQPTKAYIIQGMLESEGIHSVITNDHLVAIMPFFSNTVGGIKLQVNVEDAERALELIESEDNSGAVTGDEEE